MTEQWPAPQSTPDALAYGSEPGGPQRRPGRGFAIGAASLAGGLALGVVGIAGATSGSSGDTAGLQAAARAQAVTPTPSASPSASSSASPSAGAPIAPDGKRGGKRLGGHGGDRGGRGFGGPGMLKGGVLHGEFVTPKPEGGYQTRQTQVGTVTAVSATSITVKSEDGFSRSYAVNADTLVNAARDGITSIAVNDTVHLSATGAGTAGTATNVVDVTKLAAHRDMYAPDREKPSPNASPSIS